jgi:K+-sensing histidine kinase KdpD
VAVTAQRGEAHRSRWRRAADAAVAITALTATTLSLVPVRSQLPLASVVLLYLVPVIVTAAVGGWGPAVTAAVAADLLVNYFFIPPFHTFAVDSGDNIVVLAVYVGVAAAVSVAVDVAARHRATAARRDVEARLLAGASSQPIEQQSLARLLDQVRVTYRMSTVALTDNGHTIEQVGPAPQGAPALSAPAAGQLRLLAWGPQLFAEDRQALARLAAAAARTLETQRLADQAARAQELAHIDRLRAALLGAVGHDLRTPLAGIKAAVSSLRQPDIDFNADDRAELLATVEESTDRLTAVVDNVLSLSRLQAGVLSVDARPTPVDAVVAQAVLTTDTGGIAVDVDVPDDLPLALADPGLLERVIANLLANACTASTTGQRVLVRGLADNDRIRLDVIDHGPGIPTGEQDRIFTPFQRLNDHTGTGLGLGLAIARGFTEAQAGTLTPTHTAGGGLTMTIDIPVSR